MFWGRFWGLVCLFRHARSHRVISVGAGVPAKGPAQAIKPSVYCRFRPFQADLAERPCPAIPTASCSLSPLLAKATARRWSPLSTVPTGPGNFLADLQHDLDRRKPGTSRHTTQRQEADEVEILSGVFEGRTTGCSIGLLIRNTDQKSKDYSAIKDLFRPAHADYTYHHKYGMRDYRGGGRSSARETAMRVAAGAIAKKFLASQGITVRGYMSQLGPIEIPFKTWESVEQNAFFSPDPDKVPELEAYMDQLRRDQDSVGAKITVVAEGVMPGLGEPIFDRLDAELAHALMSINAVRALKSAPVSPAWPSGAPSTVTS